MFIIYDYLLIILHYIQDEGISLNFWQGRDKVDQTVEHVSQNKAARTESSVKRFLRELPDDFSSLSQIQVTSKFYIVVRKYELLLLQSCHFYLI